MANKPKLNYREAGVDIDAGNALIERIKPFAKATQRSEVLDGLGGFGALFELPSGYKQPVLVSATDGVGTKLKLTDALNKHDTIGIDLVAMCANDLVTLGAEPLFFLDYYATGHLDVDTAASVVKGIADGCKQAGMALVGGETAEMPGMYQGNDYDVAGFCVGIVEKAGIIDGSKTAKGDVLIALPSSGPHSNGYSLIRKVLQYANTEPTETLLTPTKIYVKAIRALCKKINVHAIAHITGGGLPENLPRVIRKPLTINVDYNSWQWPDVFLKLQALGNIADQEMLRTFNCGVGMVVCVAKNDVDNALDILKNAGEAAWILGNIS